MNDKVDRRIKKTKALLRTSLTKLMQEKSIKEITVKELVDNVDINRSTFYLHYTDINQMLDCLEEEMLTEITEIIETHSAGSFEQNTYPFIQDIFTILAKNEDLCCALLGPNGDIAFINQIENLIANWCIRMLTESFPDNMQDIKYYYAFSLSGCVGLIKTWLAKGAKESPNYMADLTFRIIGNTAYGFSKN